MRVDQGKELLSIGRGAIASALNVAYQSGADERVPWLQELGACFVTLMQQGLLRGCIGSLHAQQSLLMDVKCNAISAALHDPRFAPLHLCALLSLMILKSKFQCYRRCGRWKCGMKQMRLRSCGQV